MTRVRAFLAVLCGLAVPGCHNLRPVVTPREPPPRVTFAVHLAYDEPQEGFRELVDRDGRHVYLAPDVVLDRRHVAFARALVNEDETLLQIVLNGLGSHKLHDLTRSHRGARLAILLDDELACAPPIRGPVDGGEIHIVGIYGRGRAERLAAGLSPPEPEHEPEPASRPSRWLLGDRPEPAAAP